MLLRVAFQSAWRHFSWLLLSHWFFVSFLVVYFFVINGLKNEEAQRLSLIKDNYSLISTKTDKRKGNVFLSTPDYFLRLSELVPEVDAFLQSAPLDMTFSYQLDGKKHSVTRELPVYLVGASYFDAFDGRFIQGRGFTRHEVFSGKPMVVMTEGALIKLFGDYNRSPSLIWINGVEYQVIGTWAFNSSQIIENESLFLPLGLAQVFGKQSSTYVNNFILKGEESKTLTKLKQGIDKIQLDAGFTPSRPDFTFESPMVSRKIDFIFSHNKVYLDVILWLAFLLFVASSLTQNKQWLSFKQEWSVWSFMAKGHSRDLAKEAADFYMMVLSLSLLGAAVLALAVLIFLKYFMAITLAAGNQIHLSLFAYFLFLPLQLLLLSYWSKKMSYAL